MSFAHHPRQQDAAPVHPHPLAGGGTGHDAAAPRPLGGYAALAAVYCTGLALMARRMRKGAVTVPASVPPYDVLLIGAATYKVSRVLTKGKITAFLRAPFTRRGEDLGDGEVSDEPVGDGLRRATGELLACPFCLGTWVAAAFTCGYAAAPNATRLVAAGLTGATVSDWLHYGWTLTRQRAE